MARSNTVQVKFVADVENIRKGVSQVNQQLSTFQKAAKAVGVATAAYFAAKPIVNFASAAIDAASSMEEAVNKTNEVFEASAYKIEEWAKSSAQSVLLSENEALAAAATFGNMFTAMGAGADEAADLSIQMVQLAADLASFNDTSVDEALDALRSGLAGQTMPLRRFGVDLNAARIKAEAAAQGFNTAGSTLDGLARLMGATNVIMQDTAKAQGDVARTSDSYANATKRLEAEVQNLALAFGEGLFEGIGGAGDKMLEFSDLARDLKPLMRDLGKFAGDFAGDVLYLAGHLGKAASKMEELRQSAGPIPGIFNKVIESTKSMWNPIGFLSDRVRTLDPAFTDAALAQQVFRNEIAASVRSMNAAARAADDMAASLTQQQTAAYKTTTTHERMFNSVRGQLRVQREAREELEKSTETVTRSAGGAAKAIKDLETQVKESGKYEKFIEKTDKLIERLKDADDAVTAAKQAFSNYAEGIAESVNQLSISRAFEASGEEGGKSFIEHFRDQVTAAQNFGDLLLQLKSGGAAQALIDQIAGMGPDAGSQAAVQIIENGLIPELNEKMQLVHDQAELVGLEISDQFYGAGIQSAQNLLNRLTTKLENESKRFKKWVKDKYSTTITIDVQYNHINPPSSSVKGVQEYEAVNGRTWRQ